jgi:hypothetical protein
MLAARFTRIVAIATLCRLLLRPRRDRNILCWFAITEPGSIEE